MTNNRAANDFGFVKKFVDRRKAIEQHLMTKFGYEIVKKAIVRLESGAVSNTKYGWRVDVDCSLGDDRSASGSSAYWPRSNKGCLCWAGKKSRGICSHECAVRLKEMGY